MAIVDNSQGLSFAIPSNTILREMRSLVETGTYTQRSWLGVWGIDMSYEIAKAMGADVTYGWLLTLVFRGGPANRAGLRTGTQPFQTTGGTVIIGGDIVIAADGTRIVDGGDFLSYIAEHTLPGQTVDLTIVREKNNDRSARVRYAAPTILNFQNKTLAKLSRTF